MRKGCISLKDLNYKDHYSLHKDDNYDFCNYGLSNSLINEFLICPMKFFYKINCIELINYDNSSTAFGTIIHKYLEKFYKKKKIFFKSLQKDLISKEVNDNFLGRVYAVLKGYTKYYSKDFEENEVIDTEYTIEKDVLNIPIKCKIDLKLRDKNNKIFIADHKTSSYFNSIRNDSLVEILAIDQQTNLYLSLESEEVSDLIYNLIYNPSAKRIRKNETIQSFTARLINDIVTHPLQNFLRIHLQINNNDKKRFMSNFKQKLIDIERFFDRLNSFGYKSISYYSHSCLGMYNKPCKYLSICSTKKIDLNKYKIGSVVLKEYSDEDL